MGAGLGRHKRGAGRRGQERGDGKVAAVGGGIRSNVFNIAELRERIVEHAIRDGAKDHKLDRRTATSLRLLGRNWNDTVVSILHRNQQPLFQLSAYEGGETMIKFCRRFASSVCSDASILPFQLLIRDIEPEWKREHALCNLLTHCGPGLIELKIWINVIGTPSDIKCPRFSLSHLSKLDITVVSSQRRPDSGNNTVGLHLIKAVLKDAPALSELKVTLFSAPADTPIFGLITLPTTITNLSLRGDVRSRDLLLLSRNPLPNLTCLDLFLQYDSLADGSFFRILDTYRGSLRKLLIEDYSVPPRNTTLIRFPDMDKLEYLSVDLLKHDMDDTSMHSLEQSFPKLRTVHLQNLTEDTLRKWTGSSKFMSVTSLHFRFAQPIQERYSNFGRWIGGGAWIMNNLVTSLKMESMQSFNFAFPNVRKLELDFCGTEPSGLEYVFREMTQLTSLKINYGGSGPEVTWHFWDAVLTGLSIAVVAEAKKTPGFLEIIEVEEERLGSIKNLRELTSFSLIDRYKYLRNQRGFNTLATLISNATFRLALLKMPKLKELFFTGRFVVSGQMAKEWRSGGRSLVTKY